MGYRISTEEHYIKEGKNYEFKEKSNLAIISKELYRKNNHIGKREFEE